MFKYVRSSVAALLIGAVSFTTFATTGCATQSTIAVLTSTLGAAGASIAAIEGNPALAQKIQADTTAAVTAVNNWKSGTPSQDAVQVINILVADLNLIPAVGPYAPLIEIALATAETIITELEAGSPGVTANIIQPRAVSASVPSAKDSKSFKKLWNAAVDANPQVSKSLKLKLSLRERF